jgi:CBS domain containing-hemolysin-like protein
MSDLLTSARAKYNIAQASFSGDEDTTIAALVSACSRAITAQRSGHLQPEQRQLVDRALEFRELSVRAAMIPRTQVVAIPVGATLEQARSTFLATGYSRLPVFRDRTDDMVGVAYRKDLDMGQVDAQTFNLESAMRPAVFVPESASAGEALKRIQSSRTHFLFVVNEHGGIEGILTLEDLLEEIVVEINDEFDPEARRPASIVATGEGFLRGIGTSRLFVLSLRRRCQ